jgi:hypothetical protein
MRHRLLELARWHNKQDDPAGNGNGSKGKVDNGNHIPDASAQAETTPSNLAREAVTNLQIELLSMEEIYSAAGVLNLRKGHSINKVVGMLQSEHIRGLSNEMKRAAILMALDAAGVPLDDVLRDAKARREALDTYEAEQKKQIEAEWARRAEENIQIQAELDRIKAHYLARINRNVDGVAREKAAFSSWSTVKQQEAQRMAEAAELCSNLPVSEPAVGPISQAKALGASVKTM